VAAFRDQVRRRGADLALRHRVDGEWQDITWAEYGHQVERVAAGLLAIGVQPGDRVGLLSANQPMWHVADLAVMSIGAATVPVYPTSASSQVAYVLGHAGARACIVADRDQLAKVLLRRHQLTELDRVVVLESAGDGLDDAYLIELDELLEQGDRRLAAEPEAVAGRAELITAEDVATIVYTSGTTGPPKGTVLRHANLVWTIRSITAMVSIGPSDRFLSFLPLSHIAERIVSHFGQLVSGGQTWFASSLASVPEDLKACRPTIFFAVPRVWQKLHDAVLDRIAGLPAPARRAMDAYLSAGERVVAARQDGVRAPIADRAVHAVLDRVLGARLRSELGLDEARILVSGAAPIHPDTLRFLHAVGLPVAEVYGQTEDCGPTTLNPPDRIRIGTVGVPIPGVEVRIAEDSEILARGGNVTSGYWQDEAGTAALIDADGWMHSGDLGSIDAEGYLTITGRKKDILVTSSGKNITPQLIESRLETEPLISKAVVVGEGRPYLGALVTLDADAVSHWAAARGEMIDLEALAEDDEVNKEVGAAIDRTNRERSRIESIKRFRILPRDFTIASGELTPTLKVKRAVVTARYQDLIDQLYA
jgi:long-chain acyl-CoA synthetase